MIYLLEKISLNNLVLLLFLSIKKDGEAIIYPRVWELLERAVMQRQLGRILARMVKIWSFYFIRLSIKSKKGIYAFTDQS